MSGSLCPGCAGEGRDELGARCGPCRGAGELPAGQLAIDDAQPAQLGLFTDDDYAPPSPWRDAA